MITKIDLNMDLEGYKITSYYCPQMEDEPETEESADFIVLFAKNNFVVEFKFYETFYFKFKHFKIISSFNLNNSNPEYFLEGLKERFDYDRVPPDHGYCLFQFLDASGDLVGEIDCKSYTFSLLQ